MMIISCIAAIVLILLSVVGCRESAKTDSKPRPAKASGSPNTADDANLPKHGSRTKVLEKLRKLAETDPPKDLNPGGLCYDMALPPPRREYVCPICSEKTLYANTKPGFEGNEFLTWDLQWCRRMIKQIEGINVTLDESAFCRKCKPDAEKKDMALIVTYEDSKTPHRVSPVYPRDLTLLATFSQGKLKYGDEFTGETPLKNDLERLQTLLGITLSTPKTDK